MSGKISPRPPPPPPGRNVVKMYSVHPIIICKILPQSSAHGLVVHVRLVLMHAPEPGHGLAVHQLEDALLTVAPLDELGTTLLVLNRDHLVNHVQWPKISGSIYIIALL